MLSIDEAIANERDAADIARGNIINSNNLDGYESWNNSQCVKCAEEHEQLAEWLELLKWYQQGMEDIPSESVVLPKDTYIRLDTIKLLRISKKLSTRRIEKNPLF